MVAIHLQDSVQDQGEYLFGLLFSILGLPCRFVAHRRQQQGQRVLINYGKPLSARESEEYLTPEGWLIDIPSYPYLRGVRQRAGKEIPEVSSTVSYKEENIPFYYPYQRFSPSEGRVLLYYEDGSGAVVEKGRTIQFGFDIVASAGYLLNCTEEKLVERRDKIGRFKAQFSPRWEMGLLSQATIDRYVNILREIIACCCRRQGIPLVYKWYWPCGKNFAVYLSHDVDRVYKREFYTIAAKTFWMMKKLFSGRLRAAVSDALRLAKAVLSRQNDYWNFEKWMDLEDRYGAKSTFFFLKGRKVGRYGRRYNLRKLAQVIKTLSQNGWEVGLHGSYYSYNRMDRLRKEREELEDILGRRVRGHRQHYLRFDPEISYSCCQGAGLEYDTTLGYSDRAGYRAGTGFPFRPFDGQRGRPLDLFEIPLVVMDGALDRSGLGWKDGEAANYVIKMVEQTAASHSLISLLWHQSSLDRDDFPGWGQTYEHILKYVKSHNGWASSGEEILKWWRAREQCQYEFNFSQQLNTIVIALKTPYPKELCFKILFPDGQQRLLRCQEGEQRVRNTTVVVSRCE
ncbi:MAG: hypothetical protein B1H40_03520 [Candidatus Latescibacteria bacterium 4484_181]|nr:MAG: hypothetical protein B1H40_03520 [Candidatus Latescibacteria bacterium 4484_181]